MKFLVYTKSNCPYCSLAKEWLTNEGHEFDIIDLDDPTALSKFKNEYPDARTVPQIFLLDQKNNIRIGGYTDLVKYDFG